LLAAGCSLLFQDRRGAGRSCDPGRLASRHHNLPGTRHSPNGEEERDRSQSAVGRDTWLHVGHLLRQDGYSDHQPDVSVPRKSQSLQTGYDKVRYVNV